MKFRRFRDRSKQGGRARAGRRAGVARAFEFQALEPRQLLATSASPLVERLAQHAAAAPGDTGVGVVRIGPDGAVTETFVNADASFGTSSTIKIGILYALLRRIDANPNDGIHPDTLLNVGAQYGTNQGDTLDDDGDYTLRALARTMIEDSNNWATNRLIDYLGMNNINAEFQALGLHGTRVARYMTGAPNSTSRYLNGIDNVSTVREFTSLLRQVHENDGLLTPASHGLFFALLSGDPDGGPNDSRSYASDYYFGTDRALLTGGEWDPFANKIGSNFWIGDPGDFAKDSNLDDHLQRSEAGRMTFADGTIVFYAGFVDNAEFVHDPDDDEIDTRDEIGAEAQEVLARYGYEIGVEYSGAAVAMTPASAALDDGRVVTVRGGGGGDSIRLDANVGRSGTLDVFVNGVEVRRQDASPIRLQTGAGIVIYEQVRVLTGGGDDVVTIASWPVVDGSSVPFLVEAGSGDDTIILLTGGMGSVTGNVDGGPGFDRLVYNLQGEPLGDSFLYRQVERIEAVNEAGSPIAPGAAATLAATEGQRLVRAVVGRFTDEDPGARAADYSATIDWGDGTTSAGVVVQDASDPTVFHVLGDHAYRTDGTYSVEVTARDLGGSFSQTLGALFVERSFLPEEPVVLEATAVVADAPISATGASFAGLEGATISATVAYFTTTGPAATAADYSAVIDWGDGTTSPGVITFVGASPAGTTFRVSGSHAYARDGRYAVEARIAGVGGSGGLAGGVATVADGLVAVGPAATVSATVGTPAVGAVVARFADAGALQGLSTYAASIDWGDGSPPSPGSLEVVGTDVVVRGSHAFARPGGFAGRVTLASAGGATLSIPFASEAGAIQLAFHTPTVAEDVPLDNAALATLTALGTPSPTPSFYAASIDWGDGSPIVPGFVDASGRVLGSHTYREPGAYSVRIVVGVDGHPALLSAASTLVVTERPIILTGALSPASDAGRSNSDGLTNDATPTYLGSSEPFSVVRIYVGSDPATRREVASAVADAAGAWAATVASPLADGEYADLTAEAVDADGVTRATIALATLTVDTAGPRVVDLAFDRLGGRVVLAFQDDRGGLDQASIADGAHYRLTGRSVAPTRGAWLLVTGVSTTPPESATGVQTVTLTIDGGRPMRGGFYDLVVRSGGVADAAGNALDGEFYSYFPSGQGTPGGDFSTRLRSVHEVTLPPQPVPNGYATPNSPPGVPGRRFVVGRAPRPLGPAGPRRAVPSTAAQRTLQGLATPRRPLPIPAAPASRLGGRIS